MHKFQLLQRRIVEIGGKNQSLWSCSCDPFRENFIQNLPERVDKLNQGNLYNCVSHKYDIILMSDTNIVCV